MITKTEQEIIEKLRAQRANVRPSRALLTSILALLPADSKREMRQYFWWLRLAIPAGVAVLLGVLFIQLQKDQPTIEQRTASQPAQVLSFASLGAEEEEIEQVFAQQERIFADTTLIEEIPEQAQLEAQEKYAGYEKQQQTVLEQVEMSEQNVVKIASRRAAAIEAKLEELAREGKNVEELEVLLADAQTRIVQATTLLRTIKEDVQAKDAKGASIHAARDTFRAARKNTRDVYETFRAIARESKNL